MEEIQRKIEKLGFGYDLKTEGGGFIVKEKFWKANGLCGCKSHSTLAKLNLKYFYFACIVAGRPACLKSMPRCDMTRTADQPG